jgi:hypothetical protein
MKSRKVRPLALFVLFSVQACADRQPQTSSETHFQKCMTHADCDPDEACLALLCRPIESERDGIAIQVNGQNLSLKVDPQVHLRYLTCDLFEGMDKQVGGEWVSLRNDLPGTFYQPGSADGYMLDGQFVPPSGSAGCDLLECADLSDNEGLPPAVEYVATGTTMPPADFIYKDPFVRPSTIDVYESQPLQATKVRTYMKYFTDAKCHDRHDLALEVTMP